ALDVSIQAQIINLLEELQSKLGLTYLFIAHDLAVVKHISSRILVMYLGRVVEIADCGELYSNALHPYTRTLLSAVPVADPLVEETRERVPIRGEVPSLTNRPAGCPFHDRCDKAGERCRREIPRLHDVGGDHKVACFLYDK
ncbi:MAG: ABC transporter ATP-binding protein, partial [Paenibacillaceae bacterium]|nr:ABC transporter ATP-binding protein [Paenibacillaceae bacterium]